MALLAIGDRRQNLDLFRANSPGCRGVTKRQGRGNMNGGGEEPKEDEWSASRLGYRLNEKIAELEASFVAWLLEVARNPLGHVTQRIP